VGVVSPASAGGQESPDGGKLLGDADGRGLVPAPAPVLLALPFVRQLRASTLLAYLLCCGPTQLSSPADISVSSSSTADYIQIVSSPAAACSSDALFIRSPPVRAHLDLI
jgi:hypothetical protein